MMQLFLKEYCFDWIDRTCATKYESFEPDFYVCVHSNWNFIFYW
jgi:hypothetical protein